ncbi:MAG: alpha/beta hydrolase family protein, partial [Thermoanaerobaculia bacterium]
PAPTGSFAVGRTTFDWADDAHTDPLAPTPGTKREVLVWIWYPAAAGPSATVDDYMPTSMRVADERPGIAVRILGLLTRDSSKVHGHSLRNAAVSTGVQSFPVILMRGGASAGVLNYSTLAEDLASHGYIVAGIDAPYRTNRVVFPDGRKIARAPANNPELYSGKEFERVGNKLLAAWTADMSFVLDRLARLNSEPSGKFNGRLDMTRVGAFGHSFGGAQAAQFCSEDSRCKAAIDIDGALLGSVVQSSIRHPFLFLVSDHSRESGPETRQIVANIQSLYDRLPLDGRFWVVIRGANHFTFSDDGALLKSSIVRGALHAFGRLNIDGRRQLAVTTYCVHSFFDAYLKQEHASRPAIASPLYPEIQVVK